MAGDKNQITLRRSATEVTKYRRWIKLLKITAAILALALIIFYVISVLYTKFGSFTVTVNKYDNLNYALTLSESPSFYTTSSRLNAGAEEDVTNIAKETLPVWLDNVDGSHNGENYVAYTFYCGNGGVHALSYEYELYIANMTFNIEKAARVRLYVNGVPTDYAYPRTDGVEGPEPETTAFLNEVTICKATQDYVLPGQFDKYTVVIWLEGNDPECVDNILGGRFKVDMAFSVVEDYADDDEELIKAVEKSHEEETARPYYKETDYPLN